MTMSKSWKPEDLYLYVIVRQDLDSMGRGRAAAQASHAANQMVFQNFILDGPKGTESRKEMVRDWMDQTPLGFGTQIVKKVQSLKELEELFESLKENFHEGFPAVYGMTVDPEYFVPDGVSGHLVNNVKTAMFVLAPRNSELVTELIRPIDLLDNDPPVR